MDIFQMLDEMSNLCKTHDILFEVNGFVVIIKKYFYFKGKPYNFNQAFSFEIFKHRDLEDCVLEFERKLEKELSKIEREDNSNENC